MAGNSVPEFNIEDELHNHSLSPTFSFFAFRGPFSLVVHFGCISNRQNKGKGSSKPEEEEEEKHMIGS